MLSNELTSNLSSGQALLAGTRLEEFVIERVLGSGGFGITYLARDSKLGRQVVIKENLPAQFCWRDPTSLTVQPRQSGGEDADNFQYSLESFEKEAATLASLDHHGIVKVLRSFEANGTAYFVMPFVEGVTFDEVIKERHTQGESFTEEELTGLLWRVLNALSYLHERGIYHRDIKPGNILITADGDPVLIDFGAARQRLSERSLTVIESPGYTPFEQLQSRGQVGPWSDLYALGGTLYKAITGETPAKATDRAFDDPVEQLGSRAELRGRHTRKFMASIEKAMATKVSQRFQDAREWIKQLETRQMDFPGAEGAGAEGVRGAQFAEVPTDNSSRTTVKNSSQLQFIRVGLAVGLITIVLILSIGAKVRNRTSTSPVLVQVGNPNAHDESESETPLPAKQDDQVPSTQQAKEPATESLAAIGTVLVPDPEVAELLQTVAQLRAGGETEGLMELLKAAEGMDQNHPAVLKEFALTYEQMGLTEKAREYWQRIVNAGSAKSGNYYGLAQARLARLGVTMPSLGTSVIADPLAEARSGEGNDKPNPPETSGKAPSEAPEPPPLSEEELPPAKGNVWKVVQVDGRDYVTGQSIQLFYRFSTHKVDARHVWFRNPNLIIKGEVGSSELLVNNIKFILSYPVLYQGGQALFSKMDLCKLIEPVIRPAYIGSSEVFDTVVLDGGHGGSDSGAKGVYGYEKNYALAMVQVVREALVKRGFKVVLTRSDDTLVSEDSRVALANQTPKSIFISIHFNEGAEDESGIETFALAPQGSSSSDEGDFSNTARLGNQFDSENIALATAVHAQVVHRFKLIDRGIKRSRSTELTGLNRPGILFKGGFVTNKRECQLIASDQYRKALAEAIGDAVTNYRKALAPKPAGLLSIPTSVLSDEPSEND